jgi:RNA polymerase sigma-70 factor (ECF subfamily)
VTSSPDPTHSSHDSVPGEETREAGSAAPGRDVEPPPREELLRVRERDPDALGRFFDRYFPYVYGLTVRLLGNRAAAEDATQDVLMKVHRAIDRLDPDRDPGPWLTTITYNVARDRWRSSSDRMERQSSSIDDQPELAHVLRDAGPDPEQGALASERESLVQEALMRLPESAREVIVLHDYQGHTHERVAEILGSSHAAIRKRYSRALQTLGEILREMLDA